MAEEYTPRNQETDPKYNMEPGRVIIPGSFEDREMSKFNRPWQYRPFPKMVYRAMEWNGKPCVGAAPPNPRDFIDPREAERAEARAEGFTRDCQLIVQDERGLQQAFEMGYREHPDEAVAHAIARQRSVGTATAHRLYEDRNMSEAAQAEAQAVVDAVGGEHVPEITGRKVKKARERRSA